MDHTQDNATGNGVGRRDFFKAATAGVTTAAVLLSPRDAALAQEAAQKAALERIASNSLADPAALQAARRWPQRPAGATGGARWPGAGGPGRRGPRCCGSGGAQEIEANPNAAHALEVSPALRPRPAPTCPTPPR